MVNDKGITFGIMHGKIVGEGVVRVGPVVQFTNVMPHTVMHPIAKGLMSFGFMSTLQRIRDA